MIVLLLGNDAHLDLIFAPYGVYGFKNIDAVSLLLIA